MQCPFGYLCDDLNETWAEGFYTDQFQLILAVKAIMFIIIINTVAVLSDICDWRMMLMLLGVSSYRRRVQERYKD